MERFSHFLISDSDSEKSIEATLPANPSDDAVDGPSHGSATHESARKEIIHSLPRNAENAPPTAEQTAAPPSRLSATRDISPTTLPDASVPTSPGVYTLVEAAGHQAALLPTSHHSADSSEAARPATNSQQSGGGAKAQSVLSAPEHIVLVDSAGTDAAPPHVEAAASNPLDYHKDEMTPLASGANGLPSVTSSERGVPSVSPGARAAAVPEVGQANLIKKMRSLPGTATGPVATAESASQHHKGSNEKSNTGIPITSSSPAVAATASNVTASASATTDARLVATSAPHSSSEAGQQRDVAGAEAHPSETLLRTAWAPSSAGEIAAPPKQKKTLSGCRLFSLFKRKKKVSTAEPAMKGAMRSEQGTAIQTEAQAFPADLAAAGATGSSSGQSLSIPVAPDSAVSKRSLTQSRETNSAESKEGGGKRNEIVLPPSAHGTPAQAPAGLSVPDAATPSVEAYNEQFRAADANVEEDRLDSTHDIPPASSISEGPVATLKEPGDPAAAGSSEAWGSDSKKLNQEGVMVLAQGRPQEPSDGRDSGAGSADAHEVCGSGEDAECCAHHGETKMAKTKMAKTSTTQSVRDSLGERHRRPSAVALSDPLVKVRQPLPHSRVAAVASRLSASHSFPHSDSGSFRGSSSYSYSYSNSYGASKSPAASSAASAKISAAQKSLPSDTPLRLMGQESSTLSGMCNARNASSAAKQSCNLIGTHMEEEEPPLCMPAYWRRVLLDLRARERRDAEEAAREWQELTFRPQIHNNPHRNHVDAGPAAMADRSHTPFSEVRESSAYSPASGFSELSPARYQIRRISPRLLEPRCAPKQPAPPPFKPFISQYARRIATTRYGVFKRLYQPRSLSPPQSGETYTHRPQITKLACQLYPIRRPEGGDTTPYHKSVFDRLYRLRQSPDSSPFMSSSCHAAHRLPFQPQITDMAHRQSAVLPRESFGDRLYRNGRSLKGENHAPFHAHEGFHDNSGTEHAITESKGSGSLSWSSQSSFAVRSARSVSPDLDRRFSQTQAAVEAV